VAELDAHVAEVEASTAILKALLASDEVLRLLPQVRPPLI
jgi:hypothetical protein